MKIQIESYQKFWKYKPLIFKFFQVSLPKACSGEEIGIFAVSLLCSYLIGDKIPIFGSLPIAIKFCVLPLACTWLFGQVKFEGKNTFTYFIDLIPFLFNRKDQYEGFNLISKDVNEKMECSWEISARSWR